MMDLRNLQSVFVRGRAVKEAEILQHLLRVSAEQKTPEYKEYTPSGLTIS